MTRFANQLIVLIDIPISQGNCLRAMVRACFLEPAPKHVNVFIDDAISRWNRRKIRKEFLKHAPRETTVVMRRCSTRDLLLISVFYRFWISPQLQAMSAATTGDRT